MNNFSIIMPSRNRSNLEKCIRGARNAGETCMSIIIDDGMEPWPNPPEELEPLALRAGRKPFIFARNVNLGIESGQDVVLLNDDVLLGMFITASRVEAGRRQNRELVVKQYDLHLELLLGHDAIAGAAYPLRWNSIYNFGVRSPLTTSPV